MNYKSNPEINIKYTKDELFNYFGSKSSFNNKCVKCESKNTRVNAQTNKSYCINHFKTSVWYKNPNMDAWYSLWLKGVEDRTFMEWLDYVNKYSTIEIPEKPKI